MDSLSKKVLLADVQRYLTIKKEKEDEGLKTVEREQAYLVHEHIKQIIASQLRDALVEKDKLIEPEKFEAQDDKDSQNSLSQLLREKVVDQIVYFHAIQSIFRKYNYILTDRDI